MKNALVVILSILFIAAAVTTGVLYSKSDDRDTLLEEREDEISKLKQESRKIISDAEELQVRLDRCERILGKEQARPDLEPDYNQALKEKEKAVRALEDKETIIHDLERKLQDLENFVDGLQGRLTASQSCINTLQSDLTGYKKEVGTLREQTTKKRIDALEAEVVRFQGELLDVLQKTTSRDDIESLKAEIRKRQEEIDQLKEGRTQADSDRINELEDRIAQCQSIVNRLQQEASNIDIDRLKETMNQCRGELDKLKREGTKEQIREVEAKIAWCRQELDKFKRAGYDSRILNLEKMIDSCQTNLTALQGRGEENIIKALEVEVASCRQELDSLRGKEPRPPRKELEAELAGYRDALKSRGEAAEAKIKELEARIAAYETELEMAEKKGPETIDRNLVKDLKDKIDICQRELTELREEKSELETQACLAEIVELKLKLESVEKAGPDARIAFLESEIKRLEARLKQAEQDGSKALVEDLNEKISVCRIELEELKDRRAESQTLRAEIVELKQKLAAASKADPDARIGFLESEIKRLEARLQQAEQDGSKALVEDLNEKISVCRTELEELKVRRAESQKRQAEYAELKKKPAEAPKAGPDIRIAYLKSEIKRLEARLKQAEQDGSKALIEDLNEKISACRGELEELKVARTESQALQAEIAELKQRPAAAPKAGPDVRIAYLKSEIKRLEAQLETALRNGSKALVEDLNEKIALCRGELEELKVVQAESQTLQAEITELKQKLEASEKARPAARMAFLESEIIRLEEALKQAEQDGPKSLISGLNEKIAVCRQELETLKSKEAESETLRTGIREMKRELEALRQSCPPGSRISFLEKEIARLKDELGKTRETGPAPLIENLEHKIAQCRSELQGLREKERGDRGQVKAGASLDGKSIEKLEEELEALQKQKTEVEETIRQLRTARESLSKQLGKQMRDKSVTITSRPRQNNFSVDVVDRILFESGQAAITMEGRDILAKVGVALKGVQGKRILVVGHTDDVPISEEYRYRFDSNWELSAARAVAVTRFFQEKCGLRPDNLEAVAKSFYDPRSGNDTENGRAQNRRVEIVIGPELF